MHNISHIPTGENPAGIVHYTTTGYTSINIMSTKPEDRPLGIDYPYNENDSLLDWAKVGRHIMTYCGPVSVNEWNSTHGTLTVGPMLNSHLPRWVGTSWERNYTLFGRDTLRLSVRNDPVNITTYLFWERLGPSWLDGA